MPLASARRSIPAHAFSLKKYFGDCGGGLYRASVTGLSQSTSAVRGWGLLRRAGQGDVTGDPAITVTGIQIELGAVSSFIPTAGTTITRAAEAAGINTLGPWFNAVEGTLYAEAEQDSIFSLSKSVASLNNSAANRFTLYRFSGGSINAYSNPGALVYSAAKTAIARLAWKQAIAYKNEKKWRTQLMEVR